MGWEMHRVELALLLDSHGGEREAEAKRRAERFRAELGELVDRPEYQDYPTFQVTW